MTPQSSFMIMAAINPSREAELRLLLAGMNHEPGVLNPANSLIPFEQFEQLHFARIVIMDDQTLDDITVYKLPRVNLPTYLAILGDCDGSAEDLLAAMVSVSGKGLSSIFAHCSDFSAATDLLTWIKEHNVPSSAGYVNWVGRTLRQAKEEKRLRQALEEYLQANSDVIQEMNPRRVRETLKEFIAVERGKGRISLTPSAPTPLAWTVRNFVHLVGIPLLFLLISPLLLIALPFALIQLRRCEQSDPEVAPRVNVDHADLLASLEDHEVTNQFSAMGSLKPGLFRRITMIVVLLAIDYSTRHIFNRGRLARVTSIQFARWVFLDDKRRVIFASNYDGSLEGYMDDFINKVSFGLNVVFSNGIGYPHTDWLITKGAKDEQRFKNYLRRHQLPTQVWYNALPGLTALDKWRNSEIRDGLEKASMTDSEIQDWLRLL